MVPNLAPPSFNVLCQVLWLLWDVVVDGDVVTLSTESKYSTTASSICKTQYTLNLNISSSSCYHSKLRNQEKKSREEIVPLPPHTKHTWQEIGEEIGDSRRQASVGTSWLHEMGGGVPPLQDLCLLCSRHVARSHHLQLLQRHFRHFISAPMPFHLWQQQIQLLLYSGHIMKEIEGVEGCFDVTDLC